MQGKYTPEGLVGAVNLEKVPEDQWYRWSDDINQQPNKLLQGGPIRASVLLRQLGRLAETYPKYDLKLFYTRVGSQVVRYMVCFEAEDTDGSSEWSQ